VVGVDGSPGALVALRWALAEARLRAAPLRVVHAWNDGMVAMTGGYGYMGGFGTYPMAGVDLNELQAAAEQLVEQMIGKVGGPVDDVVVERHVVDGSAAAALIAASAPGDLLVVGSRGRGGFAALLLGSVSQQCVHHAHCPVVIVHPPTATAAEEGVAGATPLVAGAVV